MIIPTKRFGVCVQNIQSHVQLKYKYIRDLLVFSQFWSLCFFNNDQYELWNYSTGLYYFYYKRKGFGVRFYLII